MLKNFLSNLKSRVTPLSVSMSLCRTAVTQEEEIE
jgi:hypothetical protein